LEILKYKTTINAPTRAHVHTINLT
jgi:hypothetical protein